MGLGAFGFRLRVLDSGFAGFIVDFGVHGEFGHVFTLASLSRLILLALVRAFFGHVLQSWK